jgi:hypothetical protein
MIIINHLKPNKIDKLISQLKLSLKKICPKLIKLQMKKGEQPLILIF